MLTERQMNLVIDILMDTLLELKADNDGQEYDEDIQELSDAIDELDALAIEHGYELD